MKKLGCSNQRGQTMTEYILIVALIAIAVIAAVRVFGTKVNQGFENSASQVGKSIPSAK
jgi:Flp pilus assembly pilin Flp